MLKKFLINTQGNLIEVMIALVIMGALSFSFWSQWKDSMVNAGAELRTRMDRNNW